MFTCPTCGVHMRRYKTAEGLQWVCPRCDGRTATVAVLRKTLDDRYVRALWTTAATDGMWSPGKRCPACGRAMREVTTPGAPPLALDVCRLCHLVWFDAGEHARTPAAPPPAPLPTSADRGLPPEAVEAIARARMETVTWESRRRGLDDGPDQWWQVIPALFGVPVESSEMGRLKRSPILTWALAAVIVAVSAFAFTNPEYFIKAYGFIPAEAWRYGGLTAFTAFFLHGGVLHLVGNLYFFIVFGDNVEDFLGHGRYVLLLALATAFGAGLHWWIDPTSTTPCVGASGGISGLLAFYALRFPRARLGVLWWWMLYVRWIWLPAWGFFAFWVLLQLLGAYEQAAGVSNVSAMAHLGGALVGVVWGLAMRGGERARAEA